MDGEKTAGLHGGIRKKGEQGRGKVKNEKNGEKGERKMKQSRKSAH